MTESYFYGNNNYLFCPNDYCLSVPEVLYTYNPLNSFIQYKCKDHENGEKKNELT